MCNLHQIKATELEVLFPALNNTVINSWDVRPRVEGIYFLINLVQTLVAQFQTLGEQFQTLGAQFSQCIFSVLLRRANVIKVWANTIKVWANAIKIPDQHKYEKKKISASHKMLKGALTYSY